MAAKVTVTGTIGPGNSVTSLVFNGVSEFTFDTVNNRLIININGEFTYVGISAATTVTCTISGGAYTLTVS